MPIPAASPHAPAPSPRNPFRGALAVLTLTAAGTAAAASGATPATPPDAVAKAHVAVAVVPITDAAPFVLAVQRGYFITPRTGPRRDRGHTMTGEPVTLESLAFNWGDAYLFSYARDRWVALRRDRLRFLTAGTLAGLERAIEDDHRDQPVPRDFDPPGATDYLDLTGDDGVPGEEAAFILAALRQAFPSWTITSSSQLRAWIARSCGQTICENSAVLLCAALMLIERKEHRPRLGLSPQARHLPVLDPRPAPRVAATRSPVCGITRPWRVIPRRGRAPSFAAAHPGGKVV